MATSPPADPLESLFEEAWALPASERTAFLDAACADASALRDELAGLLASAAAVEAEGFLAAALPPPAETLPVPDHIGRMIGPYRLIGLLGRGGMGTVYLAERDAPFHWRVALKVMRERVGAAATRERFASEQQMLASLNHPYIARLLDGGLTEDDLPYFAMEAVEGQPLTDYADAHRLPVDARLKLFRDVCEAVRHAHQNFVLHRDLKPSNILVTAEGKVKLLDFGIAKLLDVSPGPALVTRTDVRVLTPEYASPEQIRGAPLTTASDVYSLGVVLYEILTGRRPYRITPGTTDEIIRSVCEREPARPSSAVLHSETQGGAPDGTRAPDSACIAESRATTPERLHRALRGDLDAILLKALRKEPEDRYGSVADLLQDLHRHRKGHPVLAHRGDYSYRLGRFLRRRRIEVLASMLVLLTLVGGTGVSLWQASVARAERTTAEAALAESEAVRTFMTDLFQDSGPMQAQRLTPTTEHLLERGTERAAALADQPLIQAEIFATIGRVYFSLGEFGAAQSLFEKTYALRRAFQGPQHPDLAEALILLGKTHVSFGRHDLAEAYFHQAQAIQYAHPDTPVSTLVETLRHLGDVRTRLDDIDGAESAFREALRLGNAFPVSDPISLSETLYGLASTCRRQGKKGEALNYYQAAADLMDHVYGAEHPETARARFHLGDQLMEMGREDEAAPLFVDGIRVMQAAYDGTHPRIAHGLHSLASIFVRRSHFEEAEALYRESVAMAHRLYGAENPKTGHVMNLLGDFLVDRGRFDEAEVLYQKALSIFESAFEPSHRSVLSGRVALANLLTGKGEFAKAEASLRDILSLRIEAEGARSLMAAGGMERLAAVLVQRGRMAQAEAHYLRALAIRDPLQGDDHAAKQHLFVALAAIYEAQGDADEASHFRDRVLPALRPTSPSLGVSM